MTVGETITIRLLGPDDLEVLCCQPEGLFDGPVDRAEAAAFLADPHSEMVMAVAGDLGLSFASGTVLRHPDKAPSMFVNEVGTREGWQRQGLATRVSVALIDLARARGCEGIWLGTEPGNTAALALYRRLGGEERRIVGFAWDGAFDED